MFGLPHDMGPGRSLLQTVVSDVRIIYTDGTDWSSHYKAIFDMTKTEVRRIALLMGQDVSFFREVIRGIRDYAMEKNWAFQSGPFNLQTTGTEDQNSMARLHLGPADNGVPGGSSGVDGRGRGFRG